MGELASRGGRAPTRFLSALGMIGAGGLLLAACFAPAPPPSPPTVGPAAPPATTPTTIAPTTTTSTTTTTTTAPPPPACSVAVDETDPANVIVTVSTTPAQPGVQAVAQLDWSDTPAVATTDGNGVASFPPYSLPYATTFHVAVDTTRCDGHTTTIATPPPPSCEIFVDTSNAPADVVTVKTLPALAGAPVVVDDGTAQLDGTTDQSGLATFDTSLAPPVTLTVTVNSAARCVAIL